MSCINKSCNKFSAGSIKELLKTLVDEKVVIVLSSGEKECIKVEAVMGNILVARMDGEFKFIDIDCICEVIVDCEDILGNIFRENRCWN